MKEIQLTQGLVAQVDDEDFEELDKHKWRIHKAAHYIYALRNIKNINGKRTTIYMHREIMNTHSDEMTDHVDFDGLNNQRDNLRNCSPLENVRHQRKHRNGSSVYKGVTWHAGIQKWYARIRFNCGQIGLGCHASEIEAAKAYDVAALNFFGDFAKLNFT